MGRRSRHRDCPGVCGWSRRLEGWEVPEIIPPPEKEGEWRRRVFAFRGVSTQDAEQAAGPCNVARPRRLHLRAPEVEELRTQGEYRHAVPPKRGQQLLVAYERFRVDGGVKQVLRGPLLPSPTQRQQADDTHAQQDEGGGLGNRVTAATCGLADRHRAAGADRQCVLDDARDT